MNVGTKSVLFGAHQFVIHPLFVLAAWTKLYGFPTDLRVLIAIALHDLGYVGKPNMDGPEGEAHVEWAANLMTRPFGKEWGDLCRYHSRFYCKRDNHSHSKLCAPDKLAVAMEPSWLYLPRVRASGEIREYISLAKARTAAGEPKYASMNLFTGDEERWFADVKRYLMRWAYTHRYGQEDTWTPEHTGKDSK